MSKMFGPGRWEAAFENLDAQVDEHLQAGRTQFVIQVLEMWFPGPLDVAMGRVVDYLQGAGLTIADVDIDPSSGSARICLEAHHAISRPSPSAGDLVQ